MKNRFLFFASFVCMLSLFSSCKKEYLVDVNGSVSGVVLDNYNNAVSGVLVTLDGNVATATTDTAGNFLITGVTSGSHSVAFSKTGFTKIRNTFYITTPDEVSNTTSGKKQSFNYNTVVNAQIFQLAGKVKGYVYYNNKAITGARVVAFLNSSFEPNMVSTTTDEVGAYYFDNLPVASSSITIAAYHSDFPGVEDAFTFYNNYNLSSSAVKLIDDLKISTEPLLYTKASFFKYENGDLVNIGIDTTANIELTFSQTVSENITTAKGGFVKLFDGGGVQIGATISYSGNKITIDPVASLTHHTSYYVDFKVYASESKFVEAGSGAETKFSTITRATPALGAKPAISIITNSIHLATATLNAKAYDIYKSVNGSNEFYKIATENPFTIDYAVGGTVAVGTKFYIVPVTWNDYGDRIYGTPSDVITK